MCFPCFFGIQKNYKLKMCPTWTHWISSPAMPLIDICPFYGTRRMVTYEGLFAFCLVLFGVAELIFQFHDKKK